MPGGHDGVLARREMPGAEWFPGASVNYAERLFYERRPGEAAIVHASELRELSELTWDELADMTARVATELRRLGVGRGDRVVAYMPNIPETVAAFLATASIGAIWSSAAPEFGAPTVIDRFAQIEPKVLLAVDGYRYNGKDFDRSDQVAQIEAAIPSLEHTIRVPYLAGGAWDLPEPDELELRAGAVRPSAVGPLLVRHDRAAEGDRPGPGRDPARAPEEGEPALEPDAGRPLLLVHDDGLDDVELPGRRAARRVGDRPLRRRAGARRAVAARGGRGRHVLRDERRVHLELHEGERGAAGAAAAREHRLDRVAAAAGGLPVDLRKRQGRRLAVLDQRRHRPLHRVRRRVPDPAGVRGRAAGARARGEGRGVERGGRARGRRGGRAGDHRADAFDAALLLERPGRRALPRELLRHVPRRLAPRRLAEDHGAGDRRDLRPLGLDDQPPGDPHGHERDLQRGRGGPRGARQPRDRRRRLDAAVRRDQR